MYLFVYLFIWSLIKLFLSCVEYIVLVSFWLSFLLIYHKLHMQMYSLVSLLILSKSIV